MFKDIIGVTFSRHSSLGDRVLGFLALFCMTVAVVLFLLLAYLAIDTTSLEEKNTTTTTIERTEIVPAHVTPTVVLVGKLPVTQVIPHPESYHIYFQIDGTLVSASVEKPYFDSVESGQRIEVDYGYGRLSGTYQPTAVRTK